MALFRVAGFSDTLDWRPMLFQEPIIAQKACALCGVVHRKAVRLPCVHTLCTKCHAQCVDKGSVCPVDQKPFCEDDVEWLEVSLKYILNRTAACWNAPRGCGFIGPVACLLDHYKECDFGVVPCCMCHLTVLRSDVLEHFKNGCSIPQATRKPTDSPATQVLKDVNRTCLEMKKAMVKISDDLMSLQTSLNQCSEGVRVEAARSKGQWEAKASGLAEQLDVLSTICTTGFAEVLQVLQTAMADYKEHASRELCSQGDRLSVVCKSLLSHCGPKAVRWYIEQWADLKKEALESWFKTLDSPKRAMYGYSVSQSVWLARMGTEVGVGCYLEIHPGEDDSQLEWPFSKVYAIGFIHPKDRSNVISFRTRPSERPRRASSLKFKAALGRCWCI
ncbi:hypothetical protein HPB47_014407 [Ixodes persulcatus]|uniref:Uncharacterized protein n=1 Tax=Ixodes persulcatus TaxID=34615 RepID=A0AC60QW40_IXOPE|nr:hypothetical protein HPB47_014407 [Ixodes persulcatus]